MKIMESQACTPFLKIFRLYTPEAEVREAAERLMVCALSGARERREVEVRARVDAPVHHALLRRIEDEVRTCYSLAALTLRAVCPPEALDDAYMASLMERIRETYPASNSFLEGASVGFDGDGVSLVIRLAGGGAEFLTNAGCARDMERIIAEEFERTVRVRFEGVTDLSAEEATRLANEAREAELARVQSEPPAYEEPRASRPAPKPVSEYKRPRQKKLSVREGEEVLFGKPVEDGVLPMDSLNLDLGTVTVRGEVFATDHRVIVSRDLQVVCFDMTDGKSSVRISRVFDLEKGAPLAALIKKGDCLLVQGQMVYNNFDREMGINPRSIVRVKKRGGREDRAEVKRVELHMHTNMSGMDGLASAGDLIARAAQWGHPAVAVTDHGVVQAFPDAMQAAKKHGIKVIYGVEAYYVNNRRETYTVVGEAEAALTDEFVVFDIETTGLSPRDDGITEIGAVLTRGGEEVARFNRFVNPGRPIPANIVELTGITDEMVHDAPPIEEILPAFLEFVGERVLVAHNASFDVGFISAVCERMGIGHAFTYIDTLELGRALMPQLSRHRLDSLAAALDVGSFNHHRAADDAAVLAKIFIRLLAKLGEVSDITHISQLNQAVWSLRAEAQEKKNAQSHHLIILVKNYTGLRNLYELISLSHLKYFKKRPIIPRDELEKRREGLIIGSACEAGELFQAVVRGRPWAELRKLAQFYDFLEIQPLGNNAFMIEQGQAKDMDTLRGYNETIVRLGQSTGLPIVATGDVHFLDPADEVFRRILMAGQGFTDADRQPPLYFKTTEEMLEEFSYLGRGRAYEVVVENPNKIAEMCEVIQPVPDGTYPPSIDGSAEELEQIVRTRAVEIYGDPLPQEIQDQLELELRPIIKHGFDVMYMSAQRLVKKSNEAGYLVGSRGSVGSSVVAFFAGITEVNALPPHHLCPDCLITEFAPRGQYGCGVDMPDKNCPQCGRVMKKDGFDIPFATFLGFDADKAPDIDLNFSGEYQSQAHRETVSMFGEGQVFRAGTIGTIAEKTAYGYVRKYLEERGLTRTKAEINRLTLGCTGVRRTTGQHPGGLIVVPRDKSIHDFCPVQHPADDQTTDIITTHFDYHSIHDNLLKLDLLGHDDPTMIKMLEDLTGVNAREIPLDDPETMRIFTNIRALGIEPDEVLGQTGAAAVPEFGTKFVREMLMDTRPENFDTLVRISGLSHGTDVWLGNAADLIRSKTATMKEIICARDDIMNFLIVKGVEPKTSFFIMESVRKGKGLKPEWEETMREHGVPEWYVDSCKKIKYLFPKAHAVAYVMMAFRIAWFKVHRPAAFYSAYFSIRAVAFDANYMTRGIDTVRARMAEITAKDDATAVERDQLTTLEVCYEFYRRGLRFRPVDVYASDAEKFLTDGDDALIPPLTSLPGLGLTAAQDIVRARADGSFTSVEDIAMRCPKATKAVVEILDKYGALEALPKSEQVTLFDL